MKAIRILALLLAVLMLVGVVTACGGGDETTTTPTPADPTPPPSGKTLAQALVEAGFGVVGEQNASSTVTTATSSVLSILKEVDKWIRIQDDFTPAQAGEKDITIGRTRRENCVTYSDELLANRVNSNRDWRIIITAEKVMILGATDAGICEALAQFGTMLRADSSLYFPSYDSGVTQYNWPLTQLGNQPIQNYKIVLPAGASTFYQTKATELQTAVFNASGYTLPIIDDTQSAGTTEIILGATTRPVSATAQTALRESRKNHAQDGLVKANATAIALVAATEDGMETTLASFLSDYLSDATQAQALNLHKLYQKEDVKPFSVGTNDVSEYRIVYSQSAAFEIQSIAHKLQRFLYNTCGYLVEVVTDATAPVNGQKEILFGQTNRTASTALAQTAYNMKIDVAGNLVLDAGHYTGVEDAWEQIVEVLTAQSEGSAYAITAPLSGTVDTNGFSLTWKADASLGENATLLAGFDFNTEYLMVWNDEFDGDTVNYEKWSVRPSWEGSEPTDIVLSTDEKYLSVKDGYLNLSADKTGKNTYTRVPDLTSSNTMNFSGGYLEMRSELPFKGAGEFTSYWFVTGDAVLFMDAYRRAHNDEYPDHGYYVEVDFFETVSSPNSFSTTTHKWPSGKYDEIERDRDVMTITHQKTFKASELHVEHDFGMLWTDDILAFAVDGEFYYAISLKSSNDAETFWGSLDGMQGYRRGVNAMTIILGNGIATPQGMLDSTFVGSCKDVYDEEILFPLTWTINYVRLYQTTGDSVYTTKEYGKPDLDVGNEDWDYALNGNPASE